MLPLIFMKEKSDKDEENDEKLKQTNETVSTSTAK
jgi:hypothetical protein